MTVITTPLLFPELRVSDSLITAPIREPLDLEFVKQQLRVSTTSEDALIDVYISMARQYFEDFTGRQILDATWERRIEGFGSDAVELPHPPLLEVVSVTHVDGDGADQVLVADTDYVVDAPTGPHARRGVVRPAYSVSWPSVRSGLGAVRIRYRAGYGTEPGDVPELVKGSLLFLTGLFYQFRSEFHQPNPGSSTPVVLPIGADAMMKGFKYSALPTRAAIRAVTL